MISTKERKTLISNETFSEVEKLVHKSVHSFLRTHLMVYEDAVSAAFDGYLHAYKSYEQGHGTKFSSWVAKQVNYHLFREWKSHCDRMERNKYEIPTDTRDPKRDFCIYRFKGELSKDCEWLVDLVYSKPPELTEVMLEYGFSPSKPADLRKALYQLLWDYGWEIDYIEKCFLQVQEALV